MSAKQAENTQEWAEGTVTHDHGTPAGQGHRAAELSLLARDALDAERLAASYRELLLGALAGWHASIVEQRRLEGRLVRLLDELREARQTDRSRRAA